MSPYSNLLRLWIGGFVKREPKIITIKRTKDIKLLQSECIEFNAQVSQFELNYWNKLTFPWHSNLLRCTCIVKSPSLSPSNYLSIQKHSTFITWTRKSINYVHVQPSNQIYVCVNIGYMGLASSMDFISYHTYLLIGTLGGTLVIVIGFLFVIVFHCR